MYPRLRRLFGQTFHSMNVMSIDAAAVIDNYDFLKSLKPNDAIFPVLKSNAYGHWIQEISTILKNTSAPYLCVDSYPEYQIAKKYSHKDILVIGETLPENYRFFDHKTTAISVYNLHTLKYLAKNGRPWKIHLFLNTWMNREGVQLHNLWAVLDTIKAAPHLILEWVMSHFADSDNPDITYMMTQVDSFKKMATLIQQAWFSPRYKHIGNSASIAKFDDPFFTAWRTGKCLYGRNPLTEADPSYSAYTTLQGVMRITSKVISIQQITSWDTVGYARTFTASEPTSIVTIPFGYYEGLPRVLSNSMRVKRNNQYITAAGRISMNLSSYDAGSLPVQIGDEIELISPVANDHNSITSIAQQANTIPHDVLVRFTANMRKEILRN